MVSTEQRFERCEIIIDDTSKRTPSSEFRGLRAARLSHKRRTELREHFSSLIYDLRARAKGDVLTRRTTPSVAGVRYKLRASVYIYTRRDDIVHNVKYNAY